MAEETPRKDTSPAPGDDETSSATGGAAGGTEPPPSPAADDSRDDDHPATAGAGGVRAGDTDTTGADTTTRAEGAAGASDTTRAESTTGASGTPGTGDATDARDTARSGAPGPAEGDGGAEREAGAAAEPARLPATVERTVIEKTTVPGDTEQAPDPAHDVEQRKIEAGVDHRYPFGRPGEPLGKAHPFVFGFVAALGVITAWQLFNAALNAKSVLVMIIVAMFLAVGLNPAVERLRKIGLPRGLAVAMVFMGVILFFAGFVASLVQPVSEQTTELRESIPAYVKQLQENDRLAEWDKRYGLLERAEKTVNSSGFQDKLTSWATGIGKVAVNGIFQTLTILILTLYFLSSLPQIKTFFYRLAPRSRRARVALLGDEILDRIGGYVAGQFTIAFIAGLTTYIFLSILGVKYALALALIVAVTDLIPLIGATIGAVVVTLVAFLTGTMTDGIVCIIFYIVYQQVENYLVYPRVMKRTVDVQPAVTIVAALIGGALLGVVGALLAIPTAASIALLIREVVVPRQETM
ncbi:AI-2E family transporter [Actinomadura rudentiformis]|uniref:AI-2E family transporter n=1 Tax=Actinomadura rudentiformis TaxID=359158 RepID=UPI001CEF9BD2|nr:AI-2E family transporter [Actinomadura rudentiformis]